MSLAFLSVWTERFDFRMLDIAAQNITQGNDIGPRQLVEAITLSIVSVDARGMRPTPGDFC